MKPVKILAVSALLLTVGMAQAGNQESEGEYRKAVMNILKLHMKAVDTLQNGGHPYQENLLRHALAIRSTTQLLDHVFPSTPEGKDAQGNPVKWPWENKEAFARLVANSQKAAGHLVDAAEAWQKGNKQELPKAVTEVKQSCRACHGVLRDWP